MVDTQTFQVFDSWILPIGMSSCPGRLQKKEGQTLTTFRCIHVATYYGKMGQLSGCGLLTCMVLQTKPHLVAHNEPDLGEENEELDGPALLLRAIEEREIQYKGGDGEESKGSGTYTCTCTCPPVNVYITSS